MTNLLLISSNGHSSSHLKNIHMSHNLPKTYLKLPQKETHFFRFKNGGIPSFLDFSNPCKKTRAVRHTNISQQIIVKHLTLSSHWTPTLNFLKKNKTMKHYPEHFEFILSKMKLFPPLKHQNNMSNSLHTLITTMYLTLLLLLSLTLVLNQEDLDPKIKTLQCTFALVKEKLFHNSTSDIFRSKVKFSC